MALILVNQQPYCAFGAGAVVFFISGQVFASFPIVHLPVVASAQQAFLAGAGVVVLAVGAFLVVTGFPAETGAIATKLTKATMDRNKLTFFILTFLKIIFYKTNLHFNFELKLYIMLTIC